MISKNRIQDELKRKLEQHNLEKEALEAKIDAVKKEFTERTAELKTLDANLQKLKDSIDKTQSELVFTQREHEQMQKVLNDTLASAESHNSHMEGLLDTIDYNRDVISSEMQSLMDEMKSTLYTQVAMIQSTASKVASSMHRSMVIDSVRALQSVVSFNPNTLMVVVDAKGQVRVIDNREINARAENDAAANAREGTLVPFRFFKQLSPIRGTHKNEVYSIHGLLSIMSKYARWDEQLPKGVVVEQKYNGVKVQVHKQGDKFVVWTSKRVDVSTNLPSIIASLRNAKADFIIEGEVELYLSGKNQGKSGALGVLTSPNINLAEENLRLSVYDVLLWDEEDIHAKDFVERTEYMSHFKALGKNVMVSDQVQATSKEGLIDAVMEMCKRPGSDGAVIKHPAYKYSLDGKTSMMISYKNEKSVEVRVLSADLDEVSGKYAYECSVVDENGADVYAGRTIRTDLQAAPGDILKVVFANIMPFFDKAREKHHFKLVHAKPVEVRGDLTTPTPLADMLAIVGEFKNVIQDKPYPDIKKTLDTTVTDCGCTKKSSPPREDALDIEFKLLEQTTLVGDRERSRYHLILKMPTQYIDLTSSKNPLHNDSYAAENKPTKQDRWTTTGTISRNHRLNDGEPGSSRIDIIDKGFAKLKLDKDLNYELETELFGEYMTGTLKANRQGNHNDIWDVKIVPKEA